MLNHQHSNSAGRKNSRVRRLLNSLASCLGSAWGGIRSLSTWVQHWIISPDQAATGSENATISVINNPAADIIVTSSLQPHLFILGHAAEIGDSLSLAEIKLHYRHLIRKIHPDHNPDSNANEAFRKVQEAYNALVEKIKAQAKSTSNQYDEQLETLEQDLSAIGVQLARDHHGFTAEILAHAENLNHLSEGLVAVRQEVNGFGHCVGALTKDVDGLTENMARFKERYAAYDRDIAELSAEIHQREEQKQQGDAAHQAALHEQVNRLEAAQSQETEQWQELQRMLDDISALIPQQQLPNASSAQAMNLNRLFTTSQHLPAEGVNASVLFTRDVQRTNNVI